MLFTRPHTHWRGTEPTDWGAAPFDTPPGAADAAAPHSTRHGMGLGERIAILDAAIALPLIAWWLR